MIVIDMVIFPIPSMLYMQPKFDQWKQSVCDFNIYFNYDQFIGDMILKACGVKQQEHCLFQLYNGWSFATLLL